VDRIFGRVEAMAAGIREHAQRLFSPAVQAAARNPDEILMRGIVFRDRVGNILFGGEIEIGQQRHRFRKANAGRARQRQFRDLALRRRLRNLDPH
jgi:hypothetical protein